MGFRPATLKMEARTALRESKTSPYIVALVVFVISYVISFLYGKVLALPIDAYSYMQMFLSGDADTIIHILENYHPRAVSLLIAGLLLLMSSLISVGFAYFCMLVYRRQPNSIGNIFDVFGRIGKIIWLQILTSFFIWAWSLLFVVPGIIASYRYSQAILLLLDHPELSARECISISKRMMNGRKMDFFILQVTFIGWNMLTIIPFVSVFVLPYTQTTYVAFYDALQAESGIAEYRRQIK